MSAMETLSFPASDARPVRLLRWLPPSTARATVQIAHGIGEHAGRYDELGRRLAAAGYAVYASLMAGLGALVPNLREASQATFVVILPLIIPIFFISVLIEDPNGTIALIMSLFPLTAPVAMMTRLAAAKLPFWQPLLAALLLVGTSVVVLRAVARMFRAQTLLSGQPFSLKVFFQALLGRG